MKKLFLVIGIAVLLFSCTPPIDKKFNEKTAEKDVEAIKFKLDSTDFQLLVGSMIRLKIQDKNLEQMTYAEILEDGKKWKIEQDKIEAEQKALAEKDQKKYLQAVSLYNDKKWDEALTTFLSIEKFYISNALGYIKKIQNRPWQKSYNYIFTPVLGRFSNSATQNSPLWVELRVHKKGDVYLYMYEYSDSKPSNRSALKPMYDFTLIVLGYKQEALCFEVRPRDSAEINDASHSEGIQFAGRLAQKIITTLTKSKGGVHFSIRMGSSSTYDFDMDVEEFSKAYNSL
jgi:hypothetical protein